MTMTENIQGTPIAVAWGGFIAVITLGQLNIVIGVLCGLASLIASVYAISVARATLELRRKELHRHKEQEGKEDGNT